MNLLKLINYCLLTTCIIFACVQVFIVNQIAITAHDIAKLETQISQLQEFNQNAQNELIQLSNLTRISNRALELGLTPNTTALTLQGLPPIAMSN